MSKEETQLMKFTLEMNSYHLLRFLKMLKKHDKYLFEIFAEKIKNEIEPATLEQYTPKTPNQ